MAAIIAWPAIDSQDEISSVNESLLTEEFLGDGREAIVPIPLTLDLDPAKVELGEQLFFDTSLSGNGFSCATCHPPQSAGMDGLPLSIATGGGTDVMNTPTVFNSGFNAVQQWNGKTFDNYIDFGV